MLELYSNVSGRISPLGSDSENTFEEPAAQGLDKAGLRKVVLTPNQPLNKVISSDILCIPWGSRPNNWVSPKVPYNMSDWIYLNTPGGAETLKWDGVDSYIGNTITITLTDGEWCISGAVTYCFPIENSTFFCQVFPDDYSFIKTTGPTAFFEILKIDEHVDDRGRIAFYTLIVDSLKARGHYIQE